MKLSYVKLFILQLCILVWSAADTNRKWSYERCKPLLLDKYPITLHDAVKLGDFKFIQKMINCSSDYELNKKDIYGSTPAFLAALTGDEALMDLFLNRNLNYTLVNKRGENLLHHAVIGGNINIIDKVLEKNEISLNSVDNEGNTALHLVAMGRPLRNASIVANMLLTEGGIADIKNNYHKTPFHLVVMNSSFIDIVKEMLDVNQYGFNIQDDTGRTPLQIALDNDYLDIFKIFIDHGANPFYTDFNGRTVIHNAVLKNNGVDYIRAVLQSNKKFRGDSNRIVPYKEGLNIKDVLNYTALHLAVERGYEEVFSELFNRDDTESTTKNYYGDTVLISAVKGKVFSIVKQLLQSNVSLSEEYINFSNNEGKTALHVAIPQNDESLITLLLNCSAKTDKEDSNGLTPTMLSASYSSLEVVELFENFSYDLTEALGLSVANGNDESVIEYFLDKVHENGVEYELQILAAKDMFNDLNDKYKVISVDSNTTKETSFSKIMDLITKEHEVIITELAEEDDDEEAGRFTSSPTLLNIALFFNGGLNTTKLLLNQSEVSFSDLHKENITWAPIDIAAFRNKLDIVEYFLEKDKKLVNRTDFHNQTVLHKAAWGGRCSIILKLVQNKKYYSDINKQDNFGRTPLHVAAMRGYKDTVECILKLNKESLNIKDKYDFTPLHLAEIYGHHKFFSKLQYTSITLPANERYKMKYSGINYRKRNHTATIELLLQKGADANSQDKTFGWTTLHWAASNGDLEIVKMLLTNKYSKGKSNLPSKSDQTPLYLARFWGRRDVYDYLREINAVW